MPHLTATGSTLIPAILALEELGFSISSSRDYDGERSFVAKRNDQEFTATDPLALLGLVKLIEVRGWNWQADDPQIQDKLLKYQLG